MIKTSHYIKNLVIVFCIVIINGCASLIYKSIPLKDVAKARGKHDIGTQHFYFTDSTRDMWFNEKVDEVRQVSVKIWYPAKLNNLDRRAAYVKDQELISDALSARLGVPKELSNRITDIQCNSYKNASPIKGGFPIIIYSHGHRSLKIANTFQAEELASRGFFVIALDHTYDAAITVLENNDIIFPKSKLPSNDKEASDPNMISRVEKQLDIRSKDISFLLDKLFEKFLTDDKYAGIIDTSKVGIFGHSFGGATSIQSAYLDNRIDAVFGLDAYFLPLSKRLIKEDLNKPFAHLGQTDWGKSDNYSVMKEFCSNNSGLSVHFAAEGSKHNDFTDFSQFTRLTKKYGSGKISPKKIRMIMNNLLFDFYNYHLNGIGSFDPEDYTSVYKNLSHDIY